MPSSRCLSLCLVNGCHSCRKAKNLKIESTDRRGKTCSMTILLRIVQRVQVIAANTNQEGPPPPGMVRLHFQELCQVKGLPLRT